MVVVIPVLAKNFRGLDGQRAVHDDGHVLRQTAFLAQQVQGIQKLLSPFHGESRNDDEGVDPDYVQDLLVNNAATFFAYQFIRCDNSEK